MENPYLILSLFTATLLVEGIIYALQILHTPVEPGYTYLSVGTGVSMILIGQMAGYFVLYHYNLVEWSILWIPAVVGLLGGPMFISQWWKKQQADKLIKKISDGKIDG